MPDWPHSPVHRLSPGGAYIVTAGTYLKKHVLTTPDRLSLVRDYLFHHAEKYGWLLQAWAVLVNHYHFVALAPDDSNNLRTFIGNLHSDLSRILNEQDGTPGRRVLFQYWDSHITFHNSYLARLAYVHNNPVHHRIVPVASRYPWCSAAWFQRKAKPSFYGTVMSFPCDQVNVPDDF